MLLDLFCGTGGSAAGYARAGFEVVGVDIKPQPRYPYAFIQADALDFLAGAWRGFDVIHASPPCQAYTTLSSRSTKEHPDLVAVTRKRLQDVGLPWVIENVPGAPLFDAIELCGSMFSLGAACDDGEYRYLKRHRLFESSAKLVAPPVGCIHIGQPIGVYGTGAGGQQLRNGRTYGYLGSKAECSEAMGIDWMHKRELSQAIPPAYTEYLGRQVIEHMEREGLA